MQLGGEMTYLVLDPTAADAWHLHPAYHAHHPQSRVDLLDDSAAAAFPDFQAEYFHAENASSRALLMGRRAAASAPGSAQPRATIHRLRAGQSLYVPPFFAVHACNPSPGPGPALFADLTSLSTSQIALAEAEHMQVGQVAACFSNEMADQCGVRSCPSTRPIAVTGTSGSWPPRYPTYLPTSLAT